MSPLRRASALALSLALSLLNACGGAAERPSGESLCPAGVLSCTSSAQCGSGQACTSGCCVAFQGCKTNSDCTDPSRPYCDPGTNSCAACTTSSQCSPGHVCNQAAGTCELGCAADTDCTSVAGKPICHPSGVVTYCAQCNTNTDCKDAAHPLCAAGTCFGCSTDAECAGNAAGAVCNKDSHVCVQCTEPNTNGKNAACTDASKPACQNFACTACNPKDNNATTTKNGACPTATPVCVPGSPNTCAACDPAKNAAGTLANPACPSNASICDPTRTCVGCIDATNCATGQYCSATKVCSDVVVTTVCAAFSQSGSTFTCSNSTTATVNSSVKVAVKLDVNATAATAVQLALTTGHASFSANSSVATATVTVAAGQQYAAPVDVFLDATDTTAVTLTATYKGVTTTGTIQPTAAPAVLADFTADHTAIDEGATATLVASLSSSPSGTATVTFTNHNPELGTLSASSVAISGSTSGSVTFTAAVDVAGTATVDATYNGVTKTSTIAVARIQPAVTALTPASSTVPTGGKATLTVTVAPVNPVRDTTVQLTSTGPVTLPGSTVTVTKGTTTATFDVTGSTTAAGPATVTAAANGGTKDAAVNVLPQVTSLTPAATQIVMGTPTTVTIAIDAPSSTSTRIYLNDYNKAFGSTSKQNSYMPTWVDVPAGQTSATVPFAGCKTLGATNSDVVGVGAWLRGSPGVKETTITVCPIGSAANATTGCPDTTTAPPAVCPIFPLNADQPVGMPMMVTLGYTMKRPTATTTANADLTVTPAGCGHFASAGTTITTTTFSVSGSTSGGGGAGKNNISFVPEGAAGSVCTLTVTAAGATPSSASATVRIVAPPAAATVNDLVIAKVEHDNNGSADKSEYIEIFNPTASAIDLTGYGVVLVSSPSNTIGTSTGFFDDRLTGKTEYTYVDLLAEGAKFTPAVTTIPAGGYVVVGDTGMAALTFPAGATVPVFKSFPYKVSGTSEGMLDIPGGVFLVKGGQIVDGMSYGGWLYGATSPHIANGAAFNWPLVGDPLEMWLDDSSFVTGTLVRINTSGNNNLDWRFTTTVNNATGGVAYTPITGP